MPLNDTTYWCQTPSSGPRGGIGALKSFPPAEMLGNAGDAQPRAAVEPININDHCALVVGAEPDARNIRSHPGDDGHVPGSAFIHRENVRAALPQGKPGTPPAELSVPIGETTFAALLALPKRSAVS